MAFGHHFLAQRWTDQETRDVIQSRDIERCWKIRGLGDFAVRFRPRSKMNEVGNQHLSETDITEFRAIEGQDFV